MGLVHVARLPNQIPADWAHEPGDGRVAVVVDVLRATTTVASMLDVGAEVVITAAAVDGARETAAGLPGSLLAGERGGVAPEGFDLGNSPMPSELAPVVGKTVVLTTTNGTSAVEKARACADTVLTLSLTNLSAVIARLEAGGQDTLIVCSGTDGNRSDEDELAAGLLCDRIGQGMSLSETGEAARSAALTQVAEHGGVGGALRASFHAERLVGLGFVADVAFCSLIDSTGTVPVFDPARGGFVRG